MTDFYLKQFWKLFEFGEKMFRYDEEGVFILTSVDDNFCRMLGFGRAELMIRCHNRVRDLVYPPDLPELHGYVLKELEERGEYTARYRMRRKDGELIWVWESGVMEYDQSGMQSVRNLVVNISDFENLRRDRDITYDNLPGGVLRMLITKNNFYIMQFNRQYIEMMGTTPEEYMGSSGLYTFPEDITQLKDHLIRQAERKEPVDHEFRCHCGDGDKVRWFRLIGRFYEEAEDGREYLCIMTDITERKQNVLQLEKERHRYQMAMRLTSGVLFEYNTKSKRLHVYADIADSVYIPCIEDGKFADLEAALFREDFLHPDDSGRLREYIQSDSEYSVEVRLMAKNKENAGTGYQWFEISAAKIWHHGRLRYIVGSIRHLAEKEKEESVRWRLRNIFETHSGKMYERISCVDMETKEVQVYVSERSKFREYIPECQYDDYIRQLAEKEVHPEEQERFLERMNLANMQRLLQPGQLEEVLFFRLRRREKEEYRYKCIRYSYLGDDIRTILITMQDVHQIREEQLRLEDANRKLLASALSEEQVTMEMRRNFAAMLARELYDPLEFLEHEFRRKSKQDAGIEQIRDAVSYMRRVVENISQYERLEQGKIRFENKLFELDDVLYELFREWDDNLKQSEVEITCQLNLKWKYYYGDSVGLTQCINHVIGNSVLSSGGKGRINIWGTDEDQGNGISHLCLVVEDMGIPVNENFFGRTYPIDNMEFRSAWRAGHTHMGTSFSLVVARKIIELLGGSIHLYQKGDKRNIIEITIPLQRSQDLRDKANVLTEVEERLSRVDFSDYTLLVVENTQRIGPRLKLFGAQVDTAASGEEGIRVWSGYSPYYFDAVLVEGDLPDMDYLEFAQIFRSQGSGDCRTIPILAMTEGTGQQAMKESMQKGINTVLTKNPEPDRLKQILDVWKRNVEKKSLPGSIRQERNW